MRRRHKRRKSIELAVEELKANFDTILNVNEWAEYMGYSRSYFSRKIKELFGKTPKEILKELLREKIEAEILDDPEAIGYKIAVNAGLNDDKDLHKFLNRHYDMTLNELRRELP